MTLTHTSRALCTLASLLCITAMTGCPKDDPEPDTGSGSSTAGTSTDAGKSGAAPHAGKGGTGQAGQIGQAGKAGAAPTAGRLGTGGKVAAGGAGGRSSTDNDAGVSLRCGTRGGASCGADEFCNTAPDKECGATDKGGMCEDKPQICPDIFMQVCGCDSHPYSNQCTAHAQGVSVKHDGGCTDADCESIGGHSVISDGASTPMCKADEDSYGIAGAIEGGLCCLPRKADGGSGKTCGGFGALKCASGEYCNYEAGAGGAGGQGCNGMIADAAGKCQTQPKACTREYKPVCSCDHRTYSTTCTAHSEGASVLHEGACTVKDCEAVSGRVAVGIGPAPMCNNDEMEFTSIINDDGSMAIEGMLCCVKK